MIYVKISWFISLSLHFYLLYCFLYLSWFIPPFQNCLSVKTWCNHLQLPVVRISISWHVIIEGNNYGQIEFKIWHSIYARFILKQLKRHKSTFTCTNPQIAWKMPCHCHATMFDWKKIKWISTWRNFFNLSGLKE